MVNFLKIYPALLIDFKWYILYGWVKEKESKERGGKNEERGISIKRGSGEKGVGEQRGMPM